MTTRTTPLDLAAVIAVEVDLLSDLKPQEVINLCLRPTTAVEQLSNGERSLIKIASALDAVVILSFDVDGQWKDRVAQVLRDMAQTLQEAPR